MKLNDYDWQNIREQIEDGVNIEDISREFALSPIYITGRLNAGIDTIEVGNLL